MFILDFNKVKTGDGPLYGLKNYSIKKKINALDTFKFNIPNDNPFSEVVKSEYYFQNEDNLFVIKSLKPGDEYISVEGKQDVEAIENKLWLDGFNCPTSSLLDMARLAIAGTGWTVEVISGPTYKRSLKLDKTDTVNVLQKIANKFNVEIKFDSLKKVVKFATQFGADKGVYFSDQLNANSVYNQTDTKDFATRIVARGKDGLTFASINGGKDYVEDYTYSSKLKIYMWSDARYTIAENLLEDAKLRLSVMCKPQHVYEVSIVDLVNNSEYSFLQYDLGDTVTIMNSKAGYKDVQRITELTRYPDEPKRSSVTLANCALTLEDINSKTEESVSKVDESFNEDGTINASKIDGELNLEVSDGSITVNKLAANSVNAEKIQANAITADKIHAGAINAGHIQAGTITANSGIIDDLAITSAKIANAAITIAKIQDGFIDSLVASQGKFESVHIKNGAIDTAQIHDAAITNAKIGKLAVGSANIQNASIESAHIKEIDAGKISTGYLSANVIKGQVISAINLSAETATIDSAKIGEIDAQKIATGQLSAEIIKSTVISAINISTENATINAAKIGDISADKIKSGEISTDILKSNVISAINAAIGKISADRIDVDSIKVGNIDAGQITTGDLSAERITSSVIAAINSYAGTAKIKQAQIENLKVGSANIIDLDVSKLTGDKINSKLIDVDNIFIKEGNISGTLSASKIQGGTLDFNTITVTNLKADSITAGSLTIDADNKQKNTAFTKDFSNWEYIRGETTSVNIDNINKLENVNTANIVRTEMTSSTRYYFYSGKGTIPCGAGETFTASCYFYTTDKSLIDAPVSIGVWFYDSGKNQVGYSLTSVVFENNTWVRFTNTGKAPAGATSVAFVIAVDKNANFNIGKPMLSKGSIVPIWKPHVDEQISDGAINSDKIANEAVGVDKLNLQELFVSESGFIKKLNAVNIAANQITVGKITGDQIDMAGLISFEALDTSLQPLFDVQGNKTYINGGMIAANTIKADKIDLLSGITVQGPDNTTSLAIRNDGNVEINALLRSGNFDEEKKTGYQISPDGKAILNQAVVRGDIILPNAGITNYGAVIGNENLLQATDYDMYTIDQIMDNNTNWEKPRLLSTNISTYSHANGRDEDLHIKGRHVLNCVYRIERGISQGYINPRGTGINGQQSTEYIELKPNTSYTFSGWIYQGGGATGNCKMTVYGYDNNGQSKTELISQVLTSTWLGRYEFVKFTFTTDDRKYYQTRIYLNSKSTDLTEGAVQFLFYNLKLEEGKSNTPYCPSSKDRIDYVRLWAGAAFENRNDAPFRVMQNGDLYAYNANLTGILYGEVDSGFVNILKDEIALVDDTTLPETTYVKINTHHALFNVDLSLTNSKGPVIRFVKEDKTLNMDNVNIHSSGNMSDFKFDPSLGEYGGLNLIGKASSGHHVLRHSSGADRLGTLVFDSQGNRGKRGDFSFTRKNYYEDVEVDVDGSITVKTGIGSTKQNIEIRSVENEGWGFYAV